MEGICSGKLVIDFFFNLKKYIHSKALQACHAPPLAESYLSVSLCCGLFFPPCPLATCFQTNLWQGVVSAPLPCSMPHTLSTSSCLYSRRPPHIPRELKGGNKIVNMHTSTYHHIFYRAAFSLRFLPTQFPYLCRITKNLV